MLSSKRGSPACSTSPEHVDSVMPVVQAGGFAQAGRPVSSTQSARRGALTQRNRSKARRTLKTSHAGNGKPHDGKRKNLKVLFIAHNHPSLYPGGAETYALELYREMDRRSELEPTLLARIGPTPSTHLQSHPGTPFGRFDFDSTGSSATAQITTGSILRSDRRPSSPSSSGTFCWLSGRMSSMCITRSTWGRKYCV
jgi:hypothetical protein